MNVTASNSSVRLGHNVTLTCTVTPARSLDGVIVFVRHTNNGRTTCGTIRQYPYKCFKHFATSYYYASCGSGTDSIISSTKIYTLEIRGVKEVDYTTWSCELENVITQSDAVLITQIGKYYFSLMEATYVQMFK